MSVAASFFGDGIGWRKLTFLSLIDLVWEPERNEDLGKGGHHNLNIILFAQNIVLILIFRFVHQHSPASTLEIHINIFSDHVMTDSLEFLFTFTFS